MQKIRFKFEVFFFLHQKYSRNKVNVYWWKSEKKCFVYIGGRHTPVPSSGSSWGWDVRYRMPSASMNEGWVGVRWPDWSPVIFPVTFPATFFWPFCPWNHFFRVCAVLSWFHPSSICSYDYITRVFGMIDVSGSNERSAHEWWLDS